MYANPMHRRHSFDHVELAYESYDNDRSTNRSLDMETVSDDSGGDGRTNIYIAVVFVIEILVLVFVSLVEYFLRETDTFPVRHVKFSCNDPSISYKKGTATFADFEYKADVAYEVVIPLCFALPPFLILVSELALCGFTDEPQKTVRALCHPCKIPQYVRRVFRFIGAFLFGLLVTMIFVDTIKLMTGRLRPTFLDACKPNATCVTVAEADHTFCTEKDADVIRNARLSFPSLQASMTAFCSVFMAIYLHNVIRNSSVHIIRPFLGLSFVIMSLLCGLARYGLHYNHWTDVAVGFALGTVMALYMGVFVLNNFRERMSSQRLYTKLRSFMAEQRALELRDFYKEDRLDRNGFLSIPPPAAGGSHSSGLAIPRPHVHANGVLTESSTDVADFHFPAGASDHGTQVTSERYYHQQRQHHSLPHSADKYHVRERNHVKYKQQNTFQRDLNKALDHYRRGTTPPPGHYPGHGHM